MVIKFRDLKVGRMANMHGGYWCVTGEIVRADALISDREVIALCTEEAIATAVADAINIHNAVTPHA